MKGFAYRSVCSLQCREECVNVGRGASICPPPTVTIARLPRKPLLCTLQMLARKFLHYQQDRPKITGDETEEELTGPPPCSLYLLAACMIKVGGGRVLTTVACPVWVHE